MEQLSSQLPQLWGTLAGWLVSAKFYVQLSMLAAAVALSYLATALLSTRLRIFSTEPKPGALQDLRLLLFNAKRLIFPILNIIFLGAASIVSLDLVNQDWLIRIARGLAVIFLLYSFITHFVTNAVIVGLTTWIAIPVAVLQVFGWLDNVTAYLDSISLQMGNVKISLFALARTAFFGIFLFWLGRFSASTGTRVIRNHSKLDAATREVLAKLFEISLYILIFLLLLQVMGINLTTLAIFGGALGVGLGFGLQQIASNFISGLIILLDRSVTIGDYIELEDGRKGWIRELSMRSATLETYDGKDIMVPNETFITSAFTNWTHNNKKQRYPLTFQVAYNTDLEKMFPIIREVVASHPMVMSGPDLPISERPDAEIESFGDSGINILVEFWMEEIDDGDYRVGADLLFMIWKALKENGIEIPFPQREVRVLKEKE